MFVSKASKAAFLVFYTLFSVDIFFSSNKCVSYMELGPTPKGYILTYSPFKALSLNVVTFEVLDYRTLSSEKRYKLSYNYRHNNSSTKSLTSESCETTNGTICEDRNFTNAIQQRILN